MPEPTTLQFDGQLSNVSMQYKNPEYIADLVIPPTPTVKKKLTYKEYSKDERFTIPPAYVGPKAVPNEVEWSVSDKTATCADYGLQEFVSNEEIDDAEAPIQPMSDATEFVTNLVMLAKEKRTADFVFDAGNYAAANEVDIAAGWATLSDDALTDIEVGIDACLMPPNVLVMGLPTWRKLSRNEKILAAVKGTLKPQVIRSGGVAAPAANQQELAEYLGLDFVLVGRAKRNTAKKGQTASFANVWDGTTATKGGAALLRVRAQPTTHDIVSAAHFHWKQRQVLTSDSQRGAFGGRIVRVVESTVLKSVATDVGYLFKDCLVT